MCNLGMGRAGALSSDVALNSYIISLNVPILPNEYCHMQASSCSTEDASAGAEPELFNTVANKAIYLCRPCSLQFYEFRTVWNCNEFNVCPCF
jgi:hypothetical protein